MCRCGSLVLPEFPTFPGTAPARTCSPGRTRTVPRSMLAKEDVHATTRHEDEVARKVLTIWLRRRHIWSTVFRP